MKKMTIQVTDDGPLEISGPFQMIDAEGNEFKQETDVKLCRCGYSGDKPYCDGSHEDARFESSPRAKKEVNV